MNQEMLNKIKSKKGFIAALDQSGGSTPKALKLYGVSEDKYSNEEEMFALVHDMRCRIIESNSFDGKKVLGAILFEHTMNNDVSNIKTPKYLWEKKGIVPFLKVDVGLDELKNGVKLMKSIPNFDEKLEDAKSKGIFGTKMRSLIEEFNEEGIKQVVKQQFEFAKIIISHGLVPIIEPEVSINSPDKEKIEKLLKDLMKDELSKLSSDDKVMLKLTIPTVANLYKDLYDFEQVILIVALSGGYSREDANEKLSHNDGMVASFSRALTEGLSISLSDDDFDKMLKSSVDSIFDASVNKRA